MKTHVLLIDDNKSELEIFMSALKEIGGDFKCTYASSSHQALEMLKFLRPHFIFVGHSLPTVNGLQIVSVIRNERAMDHSKVYMCMETITDEIGKMARLLGASGCIEKNATLSWLAHLFRAIFDGQLMPRFAILRNPVPTERIRIPATEVSRLYLCQPRAQKLII